MAFDVRREWVGSLSDERPEPVRVAAAGWRGRPVLFTVDLYGDTDPPLALASLRGRGWVADLFFVLSLAVAILNWRRRRIDPRGAAVVLLAAFGMFLFGGEIRVAFGKAVEVMLLYAAIEPYLRRYWPDSLITWSRVTHGTLRDPLVASHVLAGVLTAIAFHTLVDPLRVLAIVDNPPANYAGSPAAFGIFAGNGLVGLLMFLFGVVGFRLLLRKLWLADLIWSALFITMVLLGNVSGDTLALFFVVGPPIMLIKIALLRRFGFLALTVDFTIAQALGQTPLTASGWLAERVLPLQLIPIALAGWALWVILSARSIPEAGGEAVV